MGPCIMDKLDDTITGKYCSFLVYLQRIAGKTNKWWRLFIGRILNIKVMNVKNNFGNGRWNRYMRKDDVRKDSVEKWAKEQLEWIRSLEPASHETDYDTAVNGLGMMIIHTTNHRVGISIDFEALVECTYYIDRYAVAVMIRVILWQDANERGADHVTAEDVKNLFKGIPTEDQWHKAWERQKVIGDYLENLLDMPEAYESMVQTLDKNKKHGKDKDIHS